MFLKNLFAKPNLISFYKEEKYKLLNEQYKKERIIFSETKEFETKKELFKYINETIEDNPQTYISTLVTSLNQGVVSSCDKHFYKKIGIDTDNIKMVCINNKYSFYTTLYDLMEIKKTYPFIDFLYSPFAVIDINSSLRHNSLYLLSFKEYNIIMIYKNHIPVFSDIFEITEEEAPFEDIEDISDMELIEDFDENIDEDIENMTDTGEEENIENFNIEYKIINNIQTALKEYYEEDGDFIEKIFIFDTIGIEKNITTLINDELFIDSEVKQIDILQTINSVSRKNV